MLSLSNVANGSSAAGYYETADDYYSAGGSPSVWCGQGAAALGLAGAVVPAVFASLLDGRLPTGEALHHAAFGRRGGTDATFSAPKSVSLAALVGGDTRLLEAHRRAVDRALDQAEALAACRITAGGRTRSERTGNLLVARFEHDLSRACDPQLHSHCVMINATRRPDGQWRALDNESLYRNKMLLGVAYRAELAREVQTLGYGVRVTHGDGRFELEHIEDRQLNAFSRRSAAIEAHLKDQGKERDGASAWSKKIAAVLTRERKTAVDRELLRQEWRELSEQQGIDHLRPEVPARPVLGHGAAQAVLAEASSHLSERESVFDRSDLLRAALERGVGIVTLDELETALEEAQQTGLLIANGERFTTAAAQRRESEILAMEAAGRDACSPIYTAERASLEIRLGVLTDEQRHAALAVLTTRHQVTGIQGRAGVGKTRLLSETTTIATTCGYRVQGLAPSAAAARELASTGMHAETISTFSLRAHKGLNTKTLLVLDEAGMASSRQMHDILAAAQAADCRVLLVGDTAQLAAVEAGAPFAQLQAAGMPTALVGQIQRQRNPQLKAAVEHAVDGRVALAVELLEKEITQITSSTERFDRIASDYVALSPAARAQTRVIAGTRYARSEINRRIREGLGLAGQGENFWLLDRKNLTHSARRSTLSYDVGDVVQAEVDYPSLGLKRGDLAYVAARLDHRILLERKDGAQIALQPAVMTRLSVFVPDERQLAEGDLVRITANDRGRAVVNGDLATVTAIDAEHRMLTLTLTDGREVKFDGTQPLMLDHGYCSTVYGAQGQTCERVLIEADANSLTASRATFYVAISRAREAAKIYTDDREMLPAAMAREYSKSLALEVTPGWEYHE